MTNLLNEVIETVKYGEPEAWAHIKGSEVYPHLNGVILFYQIEMSTLMMASIEGLPHQGFYGFHIHAGKSCTGNSDDPFADTLSHYNPENLDHPEHAGDLPPLLYDGGMAFLACLTGYFIPEQIVGKTIVIHNMPDDFTSQPAGNAGMKIGCGVIEVNG